MKIGDFQQIAQTQNDNKRLVQDSESGDLKTSSFKGKVLSRLKGEAKDRNDQVKDAFIKSIKNTYGSEAATSARELLGAEGKALTVRDVKRVLYGNQTAGSPTPMKLSNGKEFHGVATIHRTHGGLSGVDHSLKGDFQSGMAIAIDQAGRNLDQYTFTQRIEMDASPLEKKALAQASIKEIANEIAEAHPNLPPERVEQIAASIKSMVGTADRMRLQLGDVEVFFKQGRENENQGFSDGMKVAFTEVANGPSRNKIAMATDENLKGAIKHLEPGVSSTELDKTVAAIRSAIPNIDLTTNLRGEATITSVKIGDDKYSHSARIGTGGFGEAHLMTKDGGTDTIVVKTMLLKSNATAEEKAEKLAEARKEVRAHDFAQSEGSDMTNIATITAALSGPNDTISIALEACELGDVSDLFGHPGLGTGKIDAAVTSGTISSADADALKTLLLKDMLSGMRVLQEDCQMMHLDLKPGNIFLGADGIAKIGDFGMGHEAPSAMLPGDFASTPDYLAPELGDPNRDKSQPLSATNKADTYTLGVMAYEAFTGDIPFFGSVSSGYHDARTDWFTSGGHNGLAEGNHATGNQALDDLVNALTRANPEDRIGLGDALKMDLFDGLNRANATEIDRLRKMLETVAA